MVDEYHLAPHVVWPLRPSSCTHSAPFICDAEAGVMVDGYRLQAHEARMMMRRMAADRWVGRSYERHCISTLLMPFWVVGHCVCDLGDIFTLLMPFRVVALCV